MKYDTVAESREHIKITFLRYVGTSTRIIAEKTLVSVEFLQI